MNKSEFRGLGNVFRFTLEQYVKTKSYIITLIFMAVFALAIFPFIAIRNGNEAKTENTVEKVYIINESSMENPDFSIATKDDEKYSSVVFEYTEKSEETLKEEIVSSKENAVILVIKLDLELGGFILDISYDGESDVDFTSAKGLGNLLSEWIQQYKIECLGLKDAVIDMVNCDVDFEVFSQGEFDEIESGAAALGIGDSDYWLVYAMIFVSYMVIAMSSGLISSKVVEEKSNRIVEYLMTTVRPLALVGGKILAMIVVTLINCLTVAICGFASSKISNKIWGVGAGSLMKNYLTVESVKSFSVVNITFCIILIILGVLIFGMLAGLFGSTVTKMEELQQGMKGYTMILLISFLMSYAALMIMSAKGFNPFVYATMYFPLTAPMVMPGAILIGKASLVGMILSVVLLLVVAIIFLWFISLVYESVIMTNGSVVTFKQMLSVAKQRLSGKKSAKGVKTNE